MFPVSPTVAYISISMQLMLLYTIVSQREQYLCLGIAGTVSCLTALQGSVENYVRLLPRAATAHTSIIRSMSQWSMRYGSSDLLLTLHPLLSIYLKT